jgi:hypothetical protein
MEVPVKGDIANLYFVFQENLLIQDKRNDIKQGRLLSTSVTSIENSHFKQAICYIHQIAFCVYFMMSG